MLLDYIVGVVFFFFFFKQKTAYEMRISDWGSDVCSSDLWCRGTLPLAPPRHQHHSDRVSIRSLVKMGIFSRTRDIIAANVTDLLDRAEDPEKMIRQIIFEMNETLVAVRASAARTIAAQKAMRRHIAKLESLQDRWKATDELALSKAKSEGETT